MAESTSTYIESAEQIHREWVAQGGSGRLLEYSLTPRQVAEMKLLVVAGKTIREIATMYSIPEPTVAGIRKGKSWGHIPFPPATNTDLPGEEWRSVCRFEGWYAVSNLGRVRRERSGGCSRIGRILKPSPNRDGYMVVNLNQNGIAKLHRIHCLVAEAFLGPRPDGTEVNHKSGNKADNSAANLEYISHVENLRHARRIGLHKKRADLSGDNSPSAILTSHCVLEIKRRLGDGESPYKIAPDFGVSPAAIYDIRRGRNWKSITPANAAGSD